MVYCPNCGILVEQTYQFCPSCGTKINPSFLTETRKYPSGKYEYKVSSGVQLFTILSLIFLYPFGIFFMWISGTFTLKTRWIITLSFLTAIFLGLILIIVWTTLPGYTH